MQHFDCRRQQHRTIHLRSEHPAGQENDGGSDPLASRIEQLVDRRLQVGVRSAGARTHPALNNV